MINIKDNESLKEELYDALIKKAKGYQYEETKQYIKDNNGKQEKVVEKTTKDVPPDLQTINMLLSNIDKDWNKEDKMEKLTNLIKNSK